MDPINTVKNNLTPTKIIGGLIVTVAIFALADASGLTNWIVYPVTTAKAKFSKK